MSGIADRLRLDMILYTPILQARLGEFTALDHVPAGEFVNVMPLFEVASSKRGTIADTYAFFKRTSKRLPAELRIAVDLHGHPDFLGDPGPLSLVKTGVARNVNADTARFLGRFARTTPQPATADKLACNLPRFFLGRLHWQRGDR
jgi:hypothetical protein